MILDEVHCGLGRTGKLFAHEWSGVSPDIVTIAKALGAGLPIGAILTTNNVSEAMSNGSHGSTFGGNPLCSSIASKVLDVLYEENLLSNVENLSDFLIEGIDDLIKKHGNKIASIKGKGFMIGIECLTDNGKIAEEALKNGLLLVPAANNVLRILPPLNIGKSEIEEFFNLLNITLENLDD